ncbi:MAG: sodium:calcium antiporter [bacterium]|jgi:cation:H+ antiporter
MTKEKNENHLDNNTKRKYTNLLILMFLISLPWMIIKSLTLIGIFKWDYEHYALLSAILTGITIIACAFIVSWASEVLQEYLPPNFVLALLAIINVLPEYVVDIYFTYTAAIKEGYTHYAISNMTGANRMLIGLVWPLILIIYLIAKSKKEPTLPNYIQLDKTNILELSFLMISTLYCFIIPFKGNLNLIDTLILFTIFGIYIYLATKMGKREPELEGPPLVISKLPEKLKKIMIFFMFSFAGLGFLLSAEPFGESLLVLGSKIAANFGFNEDTTKFLMVQWIAPIASESPEVIVVIIFAYKLLATDAFSTVVSSKINQWTLLVGFIPLVYFISLLIHSKVGRPLILDDLQKHEILLTAAQSFFALIMILDMKFKIIDAILLFIIFSIQLVIPDIRLQVSIAYIILGFLLLSKLIISKETQNTLKESFIYTINQIKNNINQKS